MPLPLLGQITTCSCQTYVKRYTAVCCDVLETNDCDDDDCVAAETDNGNKGFSSNSKKTRCKM